MDKQKWILDVLTKYGTWENEFNSTVFSLYKEDIDEGIRDFIYKLNNHGCHTVFSCSGHSVNSVANVVFATYVSRDKILLEMGHIFEADESMFFLKEFKNKLGVQSIKMLIPPKCKDMFGIQSIKC